MNKIEKINKLNGILNQLKTEFVGLDDIIDELGKGIYPWYITPEVNNRPVIVSLWGMTGTGKTSVVNRLLELLELKNKTLTFDCGTETGESNKSISKKLYDYFMMDDVEVNQKDINNTIFVFDEFQHARSLDEDGCEVRNQSLSSVWQLIDSGKLSLQESDWNISSLVNIITDLKSFIQESPSHASIKLDGGFITDPADVKHCLESFVLFYANREIPGWLGGKNSNSYRDDIELNELDKDSDSEGEIKKPDPYRPLFLLNNNQLRSLSRKLKKANDMSYKDIIDKISSFKTLEELAEFLEEAKNIITAPVEIDCSGSIIFILGNLDNAFMVGDNVTPDIDADVFYAETSKVSVCDIKSALKTRFRPEQIARFGNNIIKYPTLNKKHFEEIINKELSRICKEFKDKFSIEIEPGDNFKKLVYFESVYPTQGVRPVFSTINSLFNPLLSDIIVYAEGKENIKVVIDTVETNFKVPTIDIEFRYSDGNTIKKNIKLTLGADRNPEKRKTRFINGIHEAGHAIMLSYCFGKLPLSIVAVSTDHGGFCITLNEDRIGEIDSISDVKNDVAVCMGGWCAEKLIFEDDKCLLGSSSDINSAWFTISSAIYKEGFGSFASYSDRSSITPDGIPTGQNDREAKKVVGDIFNQGKIFTRTVLEKEKKLLLMTGKELGEKGEISGERFMELIKEYGNELNEDWMNKAKQKNSPTYYEDRINEMLSTL